MYVYILLLLERIYLLLNPFVSRTRRITHTHTHTYTQDARPHIKSLLVCVHVRGSECWYLVRYGLFGYSVWPLLNDGIRSKVKKKKKARKLNRKRIVDRPQTHSKNCLEPQFQIYSVEETHSGVACFGRW